MNKKHQIFATVGIAAVLLVGCSAINGAIPDVLLPPVEIDASKQDDASGGPSTSIDLGGMTGGNGMSGDRTATDEEQVEFEPVATAVPGSPAARAIQLASTHEPIAAFLTAYAGWQADAYEEEGGLWGVDFYDPSIDEWLGFALVELNSGEIIEFFVPRELSTEEYRAGLARVDPFVLADPAVLKFLGDPDEWERFTEYDRWSGMWVVYFEKGLDAIGVEVYDGEDGLLIEGIFDFNTLTEEEQRENDRNAAIELAYSAPGVDEALGETDDWRTYVENQGGSRWSVSFVAQERELFFALVDIVEQQVIESRAS